MCESNFIYYLLITQQTSDVNYYKVLNQLLYLYEYFFYYLNQSTDRFDHKPVLCVRHATTVFDSGLVSLVTNPIPNT